MSLLMHFLTTLLKSLPFTFHYRKQTNVSPWNRHDLRSWKGATEPVLLVHLQYAFHWGTENGLLCQKMKWGLIRTCICTCVHIYICTLTP